jgi:hypothetical protein
VIGEDALEKTHSAPHGRELTAVVVRQRRSSTRIARIYRCTKLVNGGCPHFLANGVRPHFSKPSNTSVSHSKRPPPPDFGAVTAGLAEIWNMTSRESFAGLVSFVDVSLSALA